MTGKSNNKRKLFAAALSLATSAAMLATSTYAWLTMNKEVKVEGINMKVKTSSNLLISETNEDDSTYGTKLDKSWYALLEPTSTIDGEAFFYTLDAAGDGHKIHGPDSDNPYVEYGENKMLTAADTYAGKIKYDESFNNAYGITTANPSNLDTYKTAYGYFDYIFYLKATSTLDNSKVIMNKCNLLYDGAALEDNSWRIAMFVQETTAATQPSSIGTLVTILSPEDGDNYTTNKAVNSITTVDTVNKANNNAIVESDIDSNITKYYKVIIRIWIEGEDKSCTTEIYGTKTEEYNLEMNFSIADGETPVNQIESEI